MNSDPTPTTQTASYLENSDSAESTADQPTAPASIPNFDEIEATARPLDVPEADRAVEVAEDLLGTPVGAHLLGHDILMAAAKGRDILMNAAGSAVDDILATMESFAENVDTIEVDGVTYRLTTLFKLKGKQRKDAWRIINETRALFQWDTLDFQKILDTLIGADRAEEFFATLYVPEGQTYDRTKLAERIEAMEELELGQMMGATYRFFISKRSSIHAAIRIFLEDLVDRSILKL
jgi:hypothetical protein